MDETGTDSGARVVRVIWLALLTSNCFYGAFAFIVIPRASGRFAQAVSNPVIIGAHAMGLVVCALAFLAPGLLVRGENPQGPIHAPSAPQSAAVVDARMRTRLITRWALIEALALFGLIAAFLGRDARLFLPLGGLAIVSMLLTYPSDPALNEMSGS